MTADPLIVQALAGSSVVIAATDAGRNDNFVYTRRAAAELAVALGARLVLYDRSAETWADTPHMHQVCDEQQARDMGASELVAQLAEARELGVHKTSAYLASIPTFDGFNDAVRTSHADVIVAPRRLDHPKFLDRFQIPDGDLVERLHRDHPTIPIAVAEADGTLQLH